MAEQQQKTTEPAADLYLQLEGIHGSVTEPGHEGWIKIQSLQFGAGVAISNGGGRRYNQSREEREADKKKKEEEEAAAEKAAAERGETEDERWERKVRSTVECSSASLSEVTVTKETDASSPLLFHHVVLRKPVRRATIELVHRTDKSVTRFTLDTVFVSSFSLSVGNRSSNGRPAESFSLNFRHVNFSVAAADDVKAAVGYDLTAKEVHLNGEALKPFWPEKDDDNDY
jgi:type VI protein secretion system component Hcp